MCEKIVTKGSARTIDSCLLDELEELKNTFPRFKEKFRMIMSCCGHDKYVKTLIVQNKRSGYCFEWFTGTHLEGTKRKDSREPFYKRDPEGHYYIPEVSTPQSKGFRLNKHLDIIKNEQKVGKIESLKS